MSQYLPSIFIAEEDSPLEIAAIIYDSHAAKTKEGDRIVTEADAPVSSSIGRFFASS